MKIFKQRKYLSVKSRIILSIVLFVLFIFGLIFIFSFINAKKVNRENIKLRLLNMVSIASLQVNTEEHSLLKTRSDEDTLAYKDLKNRLQKIRDISTDIHYIYTMREDVNKSIYFVVDAEEDPVNVSHLGDLYPDASEFLINNFSTIDKPVVEKDFTTDKWGTWMSGYAPFYDKNGKKEGVLGIDIESSSILNEERKMLMYYLLVFSLLGLLSVIVGLVLSRRLTKYISFFIDILKNTNKDIDISTIENYGFGDLEKKIKTTITQSNMSQKNTESALLEKANSLEKMNKSMIGRELEMIKLKKELIDLKNSINIKNNTYK